MQLNESSLKRLENHMLKHDTALISAMCSKTSKRQNRERVAKLEKDAMLCASHYSSTKVYGGFLKNESDEIHENTLFMVDLKDSGNLKSDVKKWGAEFQQGSVIFIPAGTLNGQIIGTSQCDNATPAFNVVADIGKIKLDKIGMKFSEFGGRPFIFEKIEMQKLNGWSGAGLMQAMEKYAPYYIFEYFGDFYDQDHD